MTHNHRTEEVLEETEKGYGTTNQDNLDTVPRLHDADCGGAGVLAVEPVPVQERRTGEGSACPRVGSHSAKRFRARTVPQEDIYRFGIRLLGNQQLQGFGD